MTEAIDFNIKNEIDNRIRNIENAYYNRDKWLFVKLQSLIEYAFNVFDNNSLNLVVNSNFSMKYPEIKETINLKYNYLHFFLNTYKVINRYANHIKHFSDDMDYSLKSEFIPLINFDNNRIMFLFGMVNRYLHNLFSDLNRQISISEHISTDKQKTELRNDSLRDEDKIYIASAGNESGSGLIIKNLILKSNINVYENSIYSIIYGILTRRRIPKRNLFIKKAELDLGIKINIVKVINFELLILMMIKNGYFKEKVNIKISFADEIYFKVAFNDIQNYVEIITNLTKKSIEKPCFQFSEEGYDLTSGAKKFIEYSTIDIRAFESEDWNASRPNYNIDIKSDDKKLMIYLLEDLFGYKDFQNGQLESIATNLNSIENSITILPTGFGKSLIFYFCALMVPGTTLVVTPTKILMEDQIRNLDNEFGIVNVFGFLSDNLYPEQISFYKLAYCSSFQFVVEESFEKIISYNYNNKFSNIVIDEIHTLSSWSHDFRAEYLMLLDLVKTNFPSSTLMGFTATATYRVIKEIMGEIGINEERIVTISNKIHNSFVYDFITTKESEKPDKLLKLISHILLNRERINDKIIIFTSDQSNSLKIVKYIEKNLHLYVSYIDFEGTTSYSEFVDGEIPILVASSDLGIGINLKDIKYSIHFDLPKSMSHYIQEIGRVSRDLRTCYSYVLYEPKSSLSSLDIKLLDFTTTQEEIYHILTDKDHKNEKSSVRNAFTSLFNTVNSIEGAVKITEVYMNFAGQTIKIGRKPNLTNFYVLYLIGVVYQWHFVSIDHNDIITVSSKKMNLNLSQSKNRLLEYLKKVGNQFKYIDKINNSNTFTDLLRVYFTWWYNEYLSFIRESLVKIIDFFEYNIGKTSSNANTALNEYLSLGKLNVTEIEDLIDNYNIYRVSNLSPNSIISLRHSAYEGLLFEYNPALDFILLCADIIKDHHFDLTRLRRIIKNVNEIDLNYVIFTLKKHYKSLTVEEQVNMIEVLNIKMSLFGIIDILGLSDPNDKLRDYLMIKLLIFSS